MKFKNLCLLTALGATLLTACNGGASSSPALVPDSTPTPDPTPTPTFCELNVANFSAVSNLILGTYPFDYTWGPALAVLPFPSDLSSCQSSATWNQARILGAAVYWIGQKVNYCHHHVPTWYPEYMLDGTTPNPYAKAAFESCSSSNDIMPPIPAESAIRWNYSGVGTETAALWRNNNTSSLYQTGNYGYGLDCSDYTKLVYSYAESIIFNSQINTQAGQTTANPNQTTLAPNMPGFIDGPTLSSNGKAGALVCADGTTAPLTGATNTSCNAHGGYISVFESNGTYNANGVTDAMLNNLQAGDLLYIAGSAYDSATPSAINPNVTHVVMWTGQKIGSSSLVAESQIAPETDIDSWGYHHGECNSGWWTAANNIGNWIITDSHYQGPDYRAFTSCFYRNQVWGVRRVLGVTN